MNILSPSILSADFANLGRDVTTVVEAGAKYIHVDVMDGQYVPRISFGDLIVKALRPVTDAVLDVHFMVVEPIRYVEEYKKSGADIMCVHVEACSDVHATLKAIREAGMKSALALNPETGLEACLPYLEEVDMILLMTVHPGLGGQKYIPSSTQKIADLRNILNERGLSIDIEVDGGISASNVQEVLDAGANVIVAGSAVFGKDAAAKARAMLEIMEK